MSRCRRFAGFDRSLSAPPAVPFLVAAMLAAAILAPPAPAAVCADGPRGVFAAALDSILGPDLASAQIGLLAISTGRGDTLMAYREGRRLIPGSNAKLFTTGALLALHGPDARRVTTLEARGRAKRLGKKGEALGYAFRGDLTLHPSGMPDVVPLRSPGCRGTLDSLAFLLRAGGLRRFEGTLYVDRTLFASEPVPAGWGADDLAYGYGAPLSPVMANGDAALLRAREDHGEVRITIEPPAAPVTIRADGISLGDSGSGGWLTPRWLFGSRVLEISGVVPRGGEVTRSVALADPDSAAALLLLDAMRREGIEAKKVSFGFLPPGPAGSGPTESDAARGAGAERNSGWNGSAAAAGWDSLLAAEVGRSGRSAIVVALPSPTVAEVVGVVDPQSLNLEAEGILRLVGPAARAKSRREGIARIYQLAAEAGIDTLDLSLVDGSGLSPQDLVTARAIVRWLERWGGPDSAGASLRAALGAPGEPGTLQARFGSLPTGALLRAKTGTLTNVSSLSGYLRTVEGEDVVFAMVVNGARRSVTAARDAEERLVAFLARVPAARGAPFLPFGWRPR